MSRPSTEFARILGVQNDRPEALRVPDVEVLVG